MDSRARNRRIIIKQLVAGQDEAGQPTQAWENLITAGDGSVRGNVRYLNGTETIKADAATATAKASIRIAYRTNVTAAMRAHVGATVFEIKAVLPDETDRQHVDLACEIVVGSA